MHIKNTSLLIDNGLTRPERLARRLCLEAAEAALDAVEPSRLVESKVRFVGGHLVAGGRKFEIAKFRKVLVIGGGKAGVSMASALHEILGDRIEGGVVNVPESEVVTARELGSIQLNGATHPLPSTKGEDGVRRMLKLVGKPASDTLVICVISGGGSALLPMPREGLELSDKVEVTRALLRAGATIQELNVVRKHLSAVKGGWLARLLYPCVVLSLVISDVVGNGLDSIASGPLYPDPSTFSDAERILGKYGLWNDIPVGVVATLRKGLEGRIPETPKPGSKFFARVFNVIVGSNEDACSAAVKHLNSSGCKTTLLTTGYEGEARYAGMFLGSIVGYAAAKAPPRAFVCGGETTVAVKGDGRGGRNQELVLGGALKISGNKRVSLLSIGTDGTDGSTDAAGAISDGSTITRGVAMDLSAEEILSRNDSYSFFKGLDDLVMTGRTGTNVNDLSIAVVC